MPPILTAAPLIPNPTSNTFFSAILWEKKEGQAGGDDRTSFRVTCGICGDTRQKLTSGFIYSNIQK
jgi:hypothetical protein